MGLPKKIQIPCHHVLANQNAFKLKKGAPLKQIFNINLGIGLIKKLLFLFIFSTYLQRDIPIEIWVKTQGDMSKIRQKQVVFLWYLSPNLY